MTSIRSIAAQLPAPESEPAWFAFRTMYKREKVVGKRLAAHGVEVYVPLKTEVRHYSSRTKTVRIPLFSSYVFARITSQDYATVLTDDDVFEIVKFQGEVGRVTEAEIDFLKTVLRDSEQQQLDPMVYAGFLPGTPIVIAGGTLAGTKGHIVEDRGKHNFVVALRTLGVSLQLVVDERHLAPLPAY